ncbi:MAG: hypothetical protein QXW73_02535 [Nitrososphaerales archaeon]
MHIAVDKNTREIVAMKVTKEHVHDSKRCRIPMLAR